MFRLPFMLLLTIMLACVTESAQADTWWVRADGAPHYSPGIADLSWRGLDPKHTCDGLHDAAWPAPGSTNVLGVISDGGNQPCAVSDWRWLYDDQGSYGKLQWIIRGGDTVVLDNTKQWRVGIDGNGLDRSQPWCWGNSSGPYGCFNPTIPAGTAQAPTRILGRNFSSCTNPDGSADRSKMSQLFGGNAVGATINLMGAANVEVGCIEVTQHASCVQHGDPRLPTPCNSDFTQSVPLSDFGSDGVYTDQTTRDVLLHNLWIHGFVDRGVIGAIGGLVTASSVDISTNGMAGWDFDDGRGTPSVNAVLKIDHSLVEFSGCAQAQDGSVAVCYGQSNGGYGDGIGTPGGSGMDVYIDRSIFRYNSQDGPDFVHVDTGNHVLEFTNNLSYGNSGAALKFGGAFRTANISNNLLLANCARLSAPMIGAVPAYNAHLGDFCRAFNGMGFSAYNGNMITISHNTLVGYAPTLVDPACTDSTCADTVVEFAFNIVRGYDNPATYALGGKAGGPGLFCGYVCDDSTVPLGTFKRDHNLFFGTRFDSQANELTGYALHETATNEMGGVDPQFRDEPKGNGASFVEAELDNFNSSLVEGSPALELGASPKVVATPIVTSTAAVPLGYVDSIAGKSSGSVPVLSTSSMVVNGWAIEYTDYGPARLIEVLVDGVALASVVPSIPRPDVVAQVTGKAVSLNCGWSLTLSAAGYAIGTHNLTAMATDSAGQRSLLTNFPSGFTVQPPETVKPLAAPVSITVVLSDGSTYSGAVTKQ